MTELIYDYRKTWTLLEHGEPAIVADLATSEALAQAQQKVTRRDRLSVRKSMLNLAGLQDEVHSESCFALSTTSPWVRVIAYTLVHTAQGADQVERFVEDSTAPRPWGVGEADITRHQLPPGAAIRVLTHERLGTGRSSTLQTVVRWIARIDHDGHDVAAVHSSFIPDEVNVKIALPMVDHFMQGVTAR